MAFSFPKIYPILDLSFLPATGRAEYLHRLGSELAAAGITLLEYRNKSAAEAELLADCAILRAALPAGKVKLILDDRAELVEQASFDGVHVDMGDLTPADARRLLGEDKIVGTFGGNQALLPGILHQPADYFAIGPVFATVTKQTTLPLIGFEGIRRLREEAGPDARLSAVGGITLERAAQAIEAGASMVAVAGAIFRQPDPVAEFRRWLAELA
jgi:thiamine-phosphate pyrophosphorylase